VSVVLLVLAFAAAVGLLAAGVWLEARQTRKADDQYPRVPAAGTVEEWQTPTRE
jgi:hypothetical protein